jgi:hypothetical protein
MRWRSKPAVFAVGRHGRLTCHGAAYGLPWPGGLPLATAHGKAGPDDSGRAISPVTMRARRAYVESRNRISRAQSGRLSDGYAPHVGAGTGTCLRQHDYRATRARRRRRMHRNSNPCRDRAGPGRGLSHSCRGGEPRLAGARPRPEPSHTTRLASAAAMPCHGKVSLRSGVL